MQVFICENDLFKPTAPIVLYTERLPRRVIRKDRYRDNIRQFSINKKNVIRHSYLLT